MPKKGKGTRRARRASDGMVWMALVRPRIIWLRKPGRLAIIPSGRR